MRRFGAPTLAWETRFDFPHLWGTRRIGPDLARAGSVRTDDWHFAHLFAPRSVVTDSVMPSYAWLFDGSPDRPLQGARDLVAYLQSLGRARELAGPDGEARARERCDCAGDQHDADGVCVAALNASPARTRNSGAAVPVLPVSVNERARTTALCSQLRELPRSAWRRRRAGRRVAGAGAERSRRRTSTRRRESQTRCGTGLPVRRCKRGATIRPMTSRP